MRILLAEDDVLQKKLLKAFFEQERHEVFLASNGIEALDILDIYQIDLALVDVMMPEMDGFELISLLRQYDANMPILVATGKVDISDKAIAFRAGADDYMVKPIDLYELKLRILALMRRANIFHERHLCIGSTELDCASWSITQDQNITVLPKKQFELLYELITHAGKFLSREYLMEKIWGKDCDTTLRTVDVHIKRLRSVISQNQDIIIETVRGGGYRAVVISR